MGAVTAGGQPPAGRRCNAAGRDARGGCTPRGIAAGGGRLRGRPAPVGYRAGRGDHCCGARPATTTDAGLPPVHRCAAELAASARARAGNGRLGARWRCSMCPRRAPPWRAALERTADGAAGRGDSGRPPPEAAAEWAVATSRPHRPLDGAGTRPTGPGLRPTPAPPPGCADRPWTGRRRRTAGGGRAQRPAAARRRGQRG